MGTGPIVSQDGRESVEGIDGPRGTSSPSRASASATYSAPATGRVRSPRALHNSSSSQRRRTLHWMPLSVLALGLLSMALLVWTRQIDEARDEDAAMANAVMDLRIRVATSHLWSEQIVSGARSGGERARAESALLDAEHLADVLGAGGEGKDFLVVSPPKDLTVRKLAAGLEELTSEWVALTRETLRAPRDAGKGSRIYTRGQVVFDQLQHEASDLESIIETEQVADIARSRRLFQGLLLVWSTIVFASSAALFHREEGRAKAADALRAGKGRLEQMVADRTRALRSVNVALLTAQETERSRISTELHDQLGHSLILMKFQFALIARQLTPDQSQARAQCADLCGYIDQTLEDVRRLARDLRPAVLHELGLSAGLRWLADNSSRDGHPVAAAVADIDSLVPRDAQVIVYRIIQQALTNAARHADANGVSLRVTFDRDWLWFVVEDDGQGFDMSPMGTARPGQGGVGLVTMQERASMVGGCLEVWSETGKGTRVTLGVPVPHPEAT